MNPWLIGESLHLKLVTALFAWQKTWAWELGISTVLRFEGSPFIKPDSTLSLITTLLGMSKSPTSAVDPSLTIGSVPESGIQRGA
jgi:hypothetical protein